MALHPEDIKAVIHRYHERLSAYREALNGLNVYPVPDGDTGTNMALTMGSVVASFGSDMLDGRSGRGARNPDR